LSGISAEANKQTSLEILSSYVQGKKLLITFDYIDKFFACFAEAYEIYRGISGLIHFNAADVTE
jgi:hypothetical protein